MPGSEVAPQRAHFGTRPAKAGLGATSEPERDACAELEATETAPDAAVATGPRSLIRFPQFVQKMIPAGLSHPQLPQRIWDE